MVAQASGFGVLLLVLLLLLSGQGWSPSLTQVRANMGVCSISNKFMHMSAFCTAEQRELHPAPGKELSVAGRCRRSNKMRCADWRYRAGCCCG
jgi:hypothetical protein